MSKTSVINRCPTGIPGFDNICQGGFVKKSVNAIVGGPGTGKTTFLMQFLWNGSNNYNENGLFVSFESESEGFYEDALTYGWDFEKLDSDGICKFIKINPESNIREIKSRLMSYVSKYNIQRICMDPISTFTMPIEKQNRVRLIVFDIVSLLKRMKTTVLIADEVSNTLGIDSSQVNNQNSYIGFLADSFVEFYSSGLGGETDRALRITKMRRTKHAMGPIPFAIEDDGIKVLNK
jgi:circadian clock protein KaiC